MTNKIPILLLQTKSTSMKIVTCKQGQIKTPWHHGYHNPALMSVLFWILSSKHAK